ncbi:hypothetical protein NIES970_01070 [[Synechococcus] sp. NIES-970]|uniref:hypothetical protein n=1 Tax=Picosynechococcus sp. NKBG15041c TaxID=1407650 RepID=UPI00097FAE98|nr:hypothetical protein [Picosynechococcus sp. NKBG15041c]BAW95205.1 hypothetical protein NIES970_01070 [[Synechococcus] sp. NIES-970]
MSIKNLVWLSIGAAIAFITACSQSVDSAKVNPEVPATAETQNTGGALSQSRSQTAEPPAPASPTLIAQVPTPDSLSPEGLRYFQNMGPLEYAARLSGVPDLPAWRVRLRLSPPTLIDDGREQLNTVTVDHYNLSPTLYQDLVDNYGAANADPSLNNRSPHRAWSFTFMPIMGRTAELLPEYTEGQTFPFESKINESCDFVGNCTDLSFLNFDGSEWREATTLSPEQAPWESDSQAIYVLVRALAQQAGWYDPSLGWLPPTEVPEGTSEARPWVEVFIDNYPGNGGGYQGIWLERVADDSVQQLVHGVFYEPANSQIYTFESYRCHRTSPPGSLRLLCP